MQRELFSGNVLVARGDEVLFRKSYGLANREWDIANDASTRFRIGSLTKQFTAVLVLQLVEEGKLALDQPLSTYLDWYPRENGAGVTLHALLNHTAGLPNYTASVAVLDDIGAHGSSPIEVAKEHCLGAPRFEPGTRFEYCNTDYFLLGVLIETVTGKPYAEVLEERILAPAGMHDSGMDEPGPLLAKRAAGYAFGLDGFENAHFIDAAAATYSAGGMYSTTDDLLRWERALFGDVLLSPASRALLCTPGLGNYGYGVYATRNGGGHGTTTVIGHNGSISGFTATLLRYVEDDLVVVLLDNTRCWDRCNPESIALGIHELLSGASPEPPRRSMKVELTERARSLDGEALVRFYRSIEGAPDYDLSGADVTLNNLGYHLLQKGRVGDARVLLELATEEFPERDYLHDSLGEALIAAGDPTRARAAFEEALRLNPANANAHAWLERLAGPK